jgi:hypothetical protein
MRLDVVLADCVPGRRITEVVHGDLEGTTTLTFDGDDARHTSVRRGRSR